MAAIDDACELHWQAGMFEGEGSIRINKQTKRNRCALLVDLANTEESIVIAFQKMWGGSITSCAAAGRRKPYWRWRAASNMAHAFLLAMWPCLRTDKYRRKAVLAIDFQAQKIPLARWLPPEEKKKYIARQVEMYDDMKALNVRGNKPKHRKPRP